MKHIMISIKPEYVCKILNREKILEIRKSVPKEVLKGEECIVELYCTKDQNKILAGTPLIDGSWKCWNRKDWNKQQRKDCGLGKYNGKVVARWHLEEYDEFEVCECGMGYWLAEIDCKKTCVSYEDIVKYGNGKTIYLWHIDNLEIYDKSKELSEFYKKDTLSHDDFIFALSNGTQTYSEYLKYQCSLKRPPQSWCYIE